MRIKEMLFSRKGISLKNKLAFATDDARDIWILPPVFFTAGNCFISN